MLVLPSDMLTGNLLYTFYHRCDLCNVEAGHDEQYRHDPPRWKESDNVTYIPLFAQRDGSVHGLSFAKPRRRRCFTLLPFGAFGQALCKSLMGRRRRSNA